MISNRWLMIERYNDRQSYVHFQQEVVVYMDIV